MNKLNYIKETLKSLSKTLKELNYSEATPLEVSFAFLPEEELLAIDVIFSIQLTCGRNDLIIGQAVLEEKELTQFSDNVLINRIVNGIVIDIEKKLLEMSSSDDINVKVH